MLLPGTPGSRCHSVSQCNLLRKLRHPNIIMFMAACTKPPNLCVVTELLQGSLFDLIHNSDVVLTWKQVSQSVRARVRKTP